MENMDNMTLEDVIQRMSDIDAEVRDSSDLEAVKALTEERKALIERKKELDDLEARKKDAEIVDQKTDIKPMEERGKMEKTVELRDTLEYKQAYLRMLKTGEDKEVRALLSTNASSGGTIPVPTYLDTEIRNAWEESQIMSKVKRTNYKGNVKIGFEYSATGAAVHAEGAAAPTEETLVLGTVEIKAESIKKWITVSDEAIDGTTIDTINYLFREIAQKITEKAEEILIGKIDAAPSTSTTTAPAVSALAANPAIDTIVKATALLSGKARDLYIVMNRQTKAEFVSAQLAANYAVDVWDGLKDRILFTDALPAFSAASATDTYAIVGSFSYGAQANFPSGNDMTIKMDDLSLAEQDLVKIVGRQYVGVEVVAPKAFTKLTKVAEG